MLMYD